MVTVLAPPIPPFPAPPGRDLKSLGASVGGGLQLRVATTHLESPTGFATHQLYSQERIAQCRQALAVLDQAREPDVFFAGDMVGAGGRVGVEGGW